MAAESRVGEVRHIAEGFGKLPFRRAAWRFLRRAARRITSEGVVPAAAGGFPRPAAAGPHFTEQVGAACSCWPRGGRRPGLTTGLGRFSMLLMLDSTTYEQIRSRLEQTPAASDSEIARAVGVGRHTVWRIRTQRRSERTGPSDSTKQDARYIPDAPYLHGIAQLPDCDWVARSLDRDAPCPTAERLLSRMIDEIARRMRIARAQWEESHGLVVEAEPPWGVF